MNSAAPPTGTVESRAPASSWYALGVLVLTTLFAFVDKQILSLIAPSLQRSLGFSDLQIGALQGLGLAIFASLASYPYGWLADRFGRRLLLAIGAAIWALSTAACAFQNSFIGLFIATIGVAVGEAGLGPIIFAVIPDLFSGRQRNTANFIYFAAALLGAAAGMALGGLTLAWIGSAHASLPPVLAGMEPWRVALLIVAAPGPIFVGLILSIRAPADRRRLRDPNALPKHGMMPILPFAKANWRTLVCVLGAIPAYGLPMNSTFVWLSVAVPRIFGTASSSVGIQMGIAFAIGSILGLLLPPVANKLLRGTSPLRSINLARAFLLSGLVPTLFMPFSSAPWQVYAAGAGQMMLGLATAAMMPGILQDISPAPLRARILAMLGIATGISAGLAPLFVGAVSELIEGPRGVLVAIVIVGLPGWLISFGLLSLGRKPFLWTIEALACGGDPSERSSVS
jgi:MFS family permease